jgi:uncharacterized surface protein with fasciclin (FAS1) repeats
MSNVLEVVVANNNLATMLRTVKAVGLETELSKTGPFTLFAPTDLAFGKLPIGLLTELMKPENKVKLTEILNHHIVEGKTNFKELKDGQKLKTIGGEQLDVKVKDGKVTINGAQLQGSERGATNGVVQSLDTVLVSGQTDFTHSVKP